MGVICKGEMSISELAPAFGGNMQMRMYRVIRYKYTTGDLE
jgi:hypothetical protein